jgi:hypothetical protein
MILNTRSLLIASLIWGASTITQAATWTGAAPILHHNPSTGDLWLTNTAEVPDSIFHAVVIIESAGHNLLAPPFNPIAGSTMDPGELPDILTFLNTPLGSFNLGNVVVPGTSSSDLSVFLVPQVLPSVIRVAGTVVAIPEPSTIALGGLALISVATLRRRQ